MKRLSTLLTAAFISLAAIAQSAGDYVYTDNGRFKIKTGENILPNGDFSKGTEHWTTDGGNTLSLDTFGIDKEGDNFYLTVYNKENGPGKGSSLMRRIPVYQGNRYIITYQVKGEGDNIETTVTSGENTKNYQNIFFSRNGLLTPDENGSIAKIQKYGWDWTTVNYSYAPSDNGYIMIHFYAPYIGTCFDNFAVMEAYEVVDDRAAAKVIARLQTYIDNPLMPNGREYLEELVNDIKGYVQNDDLASYNTTVMYIDEMISEFLDLNAPDITSHLKNGNFDDLQPTSANQRKAGAWIIDDITPASGKTRWAVKSAADTGAPFTGNYLQDDTPGPFYLREATVHQTISNMPAAHYMFTVKARAGFQNKNNIFQDFTVKGLKVFINNDSTECTPIDHEKPENYTVYSQLAEPGDLKLGFYVTDSVCNHLDFDVIDLRIIGWTQEMVDEYFLGKEFSEARTTLKHSIDSANVLINNAEMIYGKPVLADAVTVAQGVYDNGSTTEDITAARITLNDSITVYYSANAALATFRATIANAADLLANGNMTQETKKPLQDALGAAEAYLATLTADNHETEGFTDTDIREQTRLLNNAINATISASRKADEKLEFITWAQQDGASFVSNLITGEDNAIVSSGNATVYAEGGAFAGHSLDSRIAFTEGLNVSLSENHGMEVNLATKNKTTMVILGLKKGDRIEMDWAMGNSSHNIMVTSANARVRLADGTWQEYKKTGKDNANLLPKDNANGLSGSVNTTFEMTADGTLDFYQSSTNSTIRIYYIGITNEENVEDGIENVCNTTRQDNDAIYDLQGRRLNSIPASGIYISGGKKILVK